MPKEYASFLTRVNDHGVPHHVELYDLREGEVALGRLSKKDYVKLYWLLKAVTVKYSFKIEDEVIEREVKLEGDRVPRERIVEPVYMGEDGESWGVRLGMDQVVKDEGYGVPWEFYDGDDEGRYYLGVEVRAGYEVVAREVIEVMGREIVFYLCGHEELGPWNGEVYGVSLGFEYWE